jgi:hypothetical protein
MVFGMVSLWIFRSRKGPEKPFQRISKHGKRNKRRVIAYGGQ